MRYGFILPVDYLLSLSILILYAIYRKSAIVFEKYFKFLLVIIRQIFDMVINTAYVVLNIGYVVFNTM